MEFRLVWLFLPQNPIHANSTPVSSAIMTANGLGLVSSNGGSSIMSNISLNQQPGQVLQYPQVWLIMAVFVQHILFDILLVLYQLSISMFP